MTSSTIALNQLNDFFVVLARFAGFFAFVPVFGENRIPVRIRLLFAIFISIAITPVVQSTLPHSFRTPFEFNFIILIQVLIGAFAALIGQVLLSALDVAGSLIGFQMSLANALVASPATNQQTGLPSSFLSMMAMMLILTTDLHHVFIMLIIESFDLMPPKDVLFSPFIGDYGMTFLRFFSASFLLALQVAAPVIILSLLMSCAAGIMSRLMPSMQVFFILQPLQILLGMAILTWGASIVLGRFIEAFAAAYQNLWNSG